MELENVIESIRIHKNKISVKVLTMSGKDGDYIVVVSPSLHVSGYGKTKKEAEESFNENMQLFCQDILSLSKQQIHKELVDLGFKKELLHNKNFSKSYVDGNGILQNFEEGTLEKKMYEESTCA